MKSEIELELAGYSLVTAEILYRMPDHPALLQTFLWQHYDMAPKLPRLTKFLEFWEREIEGPLYRIRVAAKGLVSPRELRYCSEYGLH